MYPVLQIVCIVFYQSGCTWSSRSCWSKSKFCACVCVCVYV